MTDTQTTDNASPRTAISASKRLGGWLYPILRIAFLIFAAWLVWYTAGHWNRWTGAARFETTDDAYIAGDVTPLSARVSGYVTEMPVNDFQTVSKGDLLAVIDPSDYRAQLDQAEANLAAAQATLANLANQQRPARADPPGRGDHRGDRGRPAALPAGGQAPARPAADPHRRHAATGRTGRRQRKRTIAQLRLNEAQLDQQKALLASLDVQEKQLQAQIHAAEAQVALARTTSATRGSCRRRTAWSASARCGPANSSMSARR